MSHRLHDLSDNRKIFKVLRVRSNLQSIPRIFHKEMEPKHNKQLHKAEYPIEYSDHEQRLIYEVISGIYLKYSAR